LGLRFTEKILSKHVTQKNTRLNTKHLIDTRVKYRDALAADYTQPLQPWNGTKKKQLSFNWIMPPPGKGSGGHMNIFRFIEFLESAGHTCRIYIYTQHAPGRVSDIRNLMGDSYPKLNAEMTWIDSGDEMVDADGIFATSWETAYASFNSKSIGKRFYFVQDFEPLFYAVGSLSILAENTYKFGFYGVTAGNWLATKLKRDYNMSADHFDFGSDPELYNYKNNKPRTEIFFYARPYTERRGFEMGILALELFHKKHPDYTINLAGWDVSTYDIPFPYVNLKTLELHELNDLYNRCAAGLVMSFTNMSLLPLELLGSGAIPVVNDGENNILVSNNPYIAYSASNPVALSNELSRAVERKDSTSYAKKASKSVKAASWDESGKRFVSIVERETRKHE
jgi:glycosyltransferase involved in cell wall biosynthesis